MRKDVAKVKKENHATAYSETVSKSPERRGGGYQGGNS